MTNIQIEIEGTDAKVAAEELLKISDLEGDWEYADKGDKKEGTLATIVAIVAITSGTLTVAEKLLQWYEKRNKSNPVQSVEKVILIGRHGDRILLRNASVEQVKRLLDK